MAAMAREGWTDERLDDLNHRVDRGFDAMREEFRAVRGEISGVRGEIGAMQRWLIGLLVALVLGFGGMIVTLVLQT